ncbi:hypothetical protein VTJ83DRAFT_4516 [Remersonia thermophila]|uniref:Polysaccharide export protein n=1 Tax=Remersonia thermophila TaxID=72144 RepID=A0ABR4DC75_9PEZI
MTTTTTKARRIASYLGTRRPVSFSRWAGRVALLFLLWTVIQAHRIYYHLADADRDARTRAYLVETRRVYIASLHWNNENILRSEWNGRLLELVKRLGPENVFVSIYESGSWDNTKGALRELDQALKEAGVPSQLVLDDETHQDVIQGPPADEGWITTPDGNKMPRRIPYLSKLRNKSLQPLIELAENGTTFEHVLFLGDVVFDVDDVITLLKTNDGRYAAACSLDFSKPPSFYDTFALRDSDGHEAATLTWPYFRSAKSRKAMINADPVPVASCWNGMVAMPASTFLGISGLRFRGIPDSLAAAHLEASECCLVHADNPASASRGVFLNPAVRVGYTRAAYDAVHPSSPAASWVGLGAIWWGLWKNRLARWVTTPWFQERVVRGRIEAWKAAGRSSAGDEDGEDTWDEFRYEGVKTPEPVEAREEKGGWCVVDEMQVLVTNGWKHV